MKQTLLKLVIVSLAALTSLTLTGCGKNTMGPTSPDSLTTQTAQGVATDAAEVVPELKEGVSETLCHNGYGHKWSSHMYRWYLWKCNPWFMHHLIKFLVNKWFEDAALTARVDSILKSAVFNIILYKCGVGPLLTLKSIKLLSKTWFPGLNTNPRGCDPEITLLPYAWNWGQGFYGDRLPGWGNGNGYYLASRTPEQDYVNLDVKSFLNNVFMNESSIYAIQWRYTYFPFDMENGDIPQRLRARFTNAYWDKRLVFDDTLLEEDHSKIIVEELWASTEDKSARCKIISQNAEWLNMDLQFDATGAGGGTVDIQNWRGQVVHYVFVVNGSGHGYYTKNGGKKRRF